MKVYSSKKFNKNNTAKKEKIRQFFRKIRTFFIIIFTLGFLAILGWVVYVAKDLPSPSNIENRNVIESTKIFDRTGETLLYEIRGEQKRTVISLDQISDYAKKATIAAEDKDFYKHFGFDLTGILRAAFFNVKDEKKKQGGSTITQQFIKNSILTPEKTYSRKIKELVLSIELERRFSKDEILQMYLNEIPYGSNAYGIEAASQTFFEKSAKSLTLAEAALLASLPQAPTYYSPYGSHLEDLKSRQEWVLSEMLKTNLITQEEAENAKKEELKFSESKEGIIAPHFVMYVREKLVEKYGEKMVEQGGLKVYTTLDMKLQYIAERAVTDGVARNEKRYNASNAALVAINPKNGHILAMQGSRDYFDREHDGNVNVTIRDRQPGSSFKPFAYAAAFKKGYTPDTILFDLVTNFGGGYIPHNYDNREHGPVTMKRALACSYNIPAVKTLYLAGIDETIKIAQDMGITTLKDRERYGLSLVLGGGEVKLLDETAAYGVFANDGIKQEVSAILKVEDRQGKVLEKYREKGGKRVLDSQIARIISDILSDNMARSPVFGSRSPLILGDRPVAAKTGTTQEYRDAWTLGYTKSLVAGVWAGNNDNTPMYKGDGVYAAAPIWQQFMKEALKETEIEYFEKPEPIKTNKPVLNGKLARENLVKVDKISGKLATDKCPSHLVEEKIYKEVHNILYYVDRNNPQGPYPSQPQNDPQFKAWEAAVRLWAEGQGYLDEKPPTENCNLHTDANKPVVKINSPDKNSVITNDLLLISAEVKAPLGVARAEFYLDDLRLDVKNASPFEISYSLEGIEIENGPHVVLVKVFDKVDNIGESSIIIDLELSHSFPKVFSPFK